MKWAVLHFEQPAGSFYAGVVAAGDLFPLVRYHERRFDPDALSTYGGVQRATVARRVVEIAEYAASPDACFPTSIVIAVPEGSYELEAQESGSATCWLEFRPDRGKQLIVVDGQHRLKGLEVSEKGALFQLPVVFVLEPTEEQMAFMFATINGKQVPVPKSLIYDLFDVTEGRSPQKTAHEIARELNADSASPWFKRIKMLGHKTPGSEESLSQGTLVTRLLPLISEHPDEDLHRILEGLPVEPSPRSIFNGYFLRGEDQFIYRVLLNYFAAAANTWQTEWGSSDYLLTKAVGFSGMMKALDGFVRAGMQEKDLSREYFERVFTGVADEMRSSGIDWKSFESNAKGQGDIARLLTGKLQQILTETQESGLSS